MKTIVLAAAVCLLLLPQIARSDDLVPASWRGQPGTTGQVWEFGTSQAMGVFPDGAPAGALPPIGQTQVSISTHAGAGWLSDDMGRQGVWPLSGSLFFLIENYDQTNPLKRVEMQLVWRPQDPQAVPPQGPELFFLNPTIDSPLLRYDTPLDDVWTHSRYTWEYRPNPKFEEFEISGDINVDQVVIETWCTVPEPASLGLLGLGALALIRPRRRRG